MPHSLLSLLPLLLAGCAAWFEQDPESETFSFEPVGFSEDQEFELQATLFTTDGAVFDQSSDSGEYISFSLLVPHQQAFAVELRDLDGGLTSPSIPTAITDHALRTGSRSARFFEAQAVPTCSGGAPENVVAGLARLFDPAVDRQPDSWDEDRLVPADPDDLAPVAVRVVSLDGAPAPGQVCRPQEGPYNFILHDVPPGFHELVLSTTQHDPEAQTAFLICVPERGFAPLVNAVLIAGSAAPSTAAEGS